MHLLFALLCIWLNCKRDAMTKRKNLARGHLCLEWPVYVGLQVEINSGPSVSQHIFTLPRSPGPEQMPPSPGDSDPGIFCLSLPLHSFHPQSLGDVPSRAWLSDRCFDLPYRQGRATMATAPQSKYPSIFSLFQDKPALKLEGGGSQVTNLMPTILICPLKFIPARLS